MKIYTRRGDAGETSLANGQRIAKCDAVVEAYGTMDELISHLGLLRVDVTETSDNALLVEIQRSLFGLGAWVSGWQGAKHFPTPQSVAALEEWIDQAEALLQQPFKGFVLPGGCRAAAQAHVARTVARRVERRLCAVLPQLSNIEGLTCEDTHHLALAYLNRLSDFLFVLAKKMNHLSEIHEIKL